MPVPFKDDPVEFNGRKLLAENVFDLLPADYDCFIYEDIFSQIDNESPPTEVGGFFIIPPIRVPVALYLLCIDILHNPLLLFH